MQDNNKICIQGCSLNTKMDQPIDLPCAILVSNTRSLKEGSPLGIQNIVLGKQLGYGVQARVLELLYESKDGTKHQTGKVIKIAHQDIGHKAINAVWIGMEREWQIGVQLRAALQLPDGELPGFMRVCDALVVADTRHAPKNAQGWLFSFAGMVIEKLNGFEIYKRIDTHEFHNIHYIRECLFQVFVALDKAQRETGFYHADLGLRNVMEHYPILYHDHQTTLQDSLQSSSDAVSSLQSSPSPPQQQQRQEQQQQHMVEHCPLTPQPGWNCNRDGTRLPLGPSVEFKIIDYGSSLFSDTLAQATGGYRARMHWMKLHQLFEARHVGSKASTAHQTALQMNVVFKRSSGNATASASQDITDSPAAAAGGGGGGGTGWRWHLLPTLIRNRFIIQATAPDDVPIAISPSASLSMPPSTPSPSSPPQQQQHSLPPPVPTPRMGPIEKMYRSYWRRKGDVFHILLNLAMVLDGRVWPQEDEHEVQLFISLVHHVTGVKLKASFMSEGESERSGVMSLFWGTLRKGNRADGYGLRRRLMHGLRKARIGFKAHVFPYNSGLTAGEALVSPFFHQPDFQMPSVEPGRVMSVPLCHVFDRHHDLGNSDSGI